ncbi:MAG: LysM peptidoglycan-binding domain-containing protein [Chloroflexota bacterium]
MKRLKKPLFYSIVAMLAFGLSLSACAPLNGQADQVQSPNHSAAMKAALRLVGAGGKTPAGPQTKLSLQGQQQVIDYGDCSLLYAVQPGDTLEEIAEISHATESLIRSQNDLNDADELFPGLVLCLETNGAWGGGGGDDTPPAETRSGLEVTDVSVDDTVTIRGMNFPQGENVNVYMYQLGVSNPNIAYLGSFRIPSGDVFERSFRIPEDVRAFRNLIVRFRNPDENISASATFINANVERVTPDECEEYYTVRSGDVLGLIAQEVDVSVERLVEINNLIDASLVFPGQMLCTEVE